MKKCKCGNMVAANARFCPHCGNHFTHPFTKALLWFFGIGFVLFIIAAVIVGNSLSSLKSIDSNTATNTDSLGRPVPASVTNDAELLVYRCGKPDKDDATDYDNPRPPIPSRLITYKRAHLRFAFIPGKGTKLDDPPPYRWQLMGILDTRTGKPLTPANLTSIVRARMPCYLGM